MRLTFRLFAQSLVFLDPAVRYAANDNVGSI